MSKWDRRFIDMASLVATWSKDPSTKVGAVIVDSERRIVSTGYNGFPAGVLDDSEQLCDRPSKLKCTLHAEENAILFARRDLRGCAVYVTHHPCASCAAKIVQVGIKKVFHVNHPAMEKRWAEDIRLARIMFSETGVEVYHV